MPAIVRRDGRVLKVLDTGDEAFGWLQGYQGQSVHHATSYEGYSIEDDAAGIEVPAAAFPFLKPGTYVLLRLMGRNSTDIGGNIVGPYTLDVMPATTIDTHADSNFPVVAVMHHTIESCWIVEGGSV